MSGSDAKLADELLAVLDIVNESLQCSNISSFEKLVTQTCDFLDIENAKVNIAGLDIEGNIASMSPVLNQNFPEDWVTLYREAGFQAVDPVLNRLYSAKGPIAWSDIRSSNCSRLEKSFYGEAANFGLLDGFAYGNKFESNNASGSFFTFSGIDLANSFRSTVLAKYLMPHLHIALTRSCRGAILKSQVLLTARELEVLQLAVYGKNNWDISVALKISEPVIPPKNSRGYR